MEQLVSVKAAVCVTSILCSVLFAKLANADQKKYVIENGKPNAEIVVSEDAPRMTRLAALELQYYLAKMSGARLPIVFEQTDKYPFMIYVGESKYTKKVGVSDKGLKYGAFHIVTGADYMVLLGTDYDYNPPKPYITRNSKAEYKRAKDEWKKKISHLTDVTWKVPFGRTFTSWWIPKDFEGIMSKRYGQDNQKVWNPKNLEWTRDYYKNGDGLGHWYHDGAGSFNAVCNYLRNLGVEWYMPGDLGEVIPEQKSIVMASSNITSKPDYAVRWWLYYYYGFYSYDDTMWARRLGINTPYEASGHLGPGHGLTAVTSSNEMKEKHPEYYALIGGVRMTQTKHPSACHSSEELIKECINYARFMFDEYDLRRVSFMPADGFSKCGCDDCKDKTPSELVWGFIDNIARELHKTHPDRLVACGAYTSYAKPPESIEMFSPNVAVSINNRGRPFFDNFVKWKEYWSQVVSWKNKLAPERLIRVENNRYSLKSGRPLKFPAIHPHAIAKDVKALKGMCYGYVGEQNVRKGKWYAPGTDHLNLYVESRFCWDADNNLEEILDEYFTRFYGPAAGIMRETYLDAEKTYNDLNLRPARSLVERNVNYLAASVKFIEGLNKALKVAGEDTVYGRRIAFILSEYVPIEKIKEEYETAKNAPDPRADAPLVIGVDADSNNKPQTYHLRDIKTGEKPEYDTSFTVAWDDGDLIVTIRCEDDDMKNLFVSDNVWDGDSVALLIETPYRAYYQIEVNPEGKVFDADRKVGLVNKWDSKTQVETEKGKEYWAVKVKIPVLAPEDNQGDPYHYLVGSKPSKDRLWYFNIGRIRKRDNKVSGQTFIPTGGSYHVRENFAKLAIE